MLTFSFSVFKDGALPSLHNVSGPYQTGPEFRTTLSSQERTQALGKEMKGKATLANRALIQVRSASRVILPPGDSPSLLALSQGHDRIGSYCSLDGLNPTSMNGKHPLLGGLWGARENTCVLRHRRIKV